MNVDPLHTPQYEIEKTYHRIFYSSPSFEIKHTQIHKLVCYLDQGKVETNSTYSNLFQIFCFFLFFIGSRR